MVTNDERARRYGKAIEHFEVSIGFRDDAGDDDWASGTLERDDLNSIARAVMAVADAELAELRAELEYPDLAYAVQKGGPNLDGPTALTDEPTGDAMRWTKDDK